jgi:cobalamin synthase
MNKIIFQIGLLGFCVSAVLFGTQGMSLMETVARAFIVFIVVVCAIAVVMLMSSLIMSKDRADGEGSAPAGAARDAAAGRRPTVPSSK